MNSEYDQVIVLLVQVWIQQIFSKVYHAGQILGCISDLGDFVRHALITGMLLWEQHADLLFDNMKFCEKSKILSTSICHLFTSYSQFLINVHNSHTHLYSLMYIQTHIQIASSSLSNIKSQKHTSTYINHSWKRRL